MERCENCMWSIYDSGCLEYYCYVKDKFLSESNICIDFCDKNKHFLDLVKHGRKLQQTEIEVKDNGE